MSDAKIEYLVEYGSDKYGYWVRVDNIATNETVEEYVAGNCPYDSDTVLEPALFDTVPVKTLGEYAEQTANEIAENYRNGANVIV